MYFWTHFFAGYDTGPTGVRDHLQRADCWVWIWMRSFRAPMGDAWRWATMPWMMALFGFAVVPLGRSGWVREVDGILHLTGHLTSEVFPEPLAHQV